MTGSALPWLVVACEALLAVGVMFVLYVVGIRNTRRRSRASARRLVERIRAQEPERLAAVRKLLIAAGDVDEQAALQQAEELMARERSFYSRVLKAFLGRDTDALEDLEQGLAELTERYRVLGETSARAPRASGDDAGSTDSQDVNADLQRQNRELQAQLAQANEKLENITREYMAVYRQQAATGVKTGGEGEPVSPGRKPRD